MTLVSLPSLNIPYPLPCLRQFSTTAFSSLSKSPGVPDMFNSSRKARGQSLSHSGVLIKILQKPGDSIKVNGFNKVPEPAPAPPQKSSKMKNLAIDFGVGTAATVAGNELLKPNTENGTHLADLANQNQLTTSTMLSNGTNPNQANDTTNQILTYTSDLTSSANSTTPNSTTTTTQAQKKRALVHGLPVNIFSECGTTSSHGL